MGRFRQKGFYPKYCLPLANNSLRTLAYAACVTDDFSPQFSSSSSHIISPAAAAERAAYELQESLEEVPPWKNANKAPIPLSLGEF